MEEGHEPARGSVVTVVTSLWELAPELTQDRHDTGPGFDPTTPLPSPGLLARVQGCKGACKDVLKMPSELPDEITWHALRQ